MSTLYDDLDPNTLAGAAGSAVSSLPGSQGNITLSQATGASQPTISTTAIIGKKTLHSSGSQWMGSNTFTTLPTGSVIFAVVQYTQTGSFQPAISSNAGALYGDNCAFWSPNNAGTYGYRIVGGMQTALIEIVVNGSSSELRINGTLAFTGSIWSTVTKIGFFTDNPTTESFGMAGDFARLQVYTAMTGAERATQRESLASAYGITLDESTDVRFSVTTGTLADGQAYRIHQSVNYSSGTPAIAVILCHGSGGAPNELFSEPGMGAWQDAVFAMGGIVAAVQLNNTFDQVDLQDNVQFTTDLINFLNANYNISHFVLVGESRGGCVSLLTLTNNPTSKCVGWIGLYAACDAVTWWGTSDPTLNPLTVTKSKYNGMRLQFNASAGDTTVPKSSNSDALYAYVAGQCAERTDVATAGNHGDISNAGYHRTLLFLQRAIGTTPEFTISPASGSGPAGTASIAFAVAIANGTATDPGNGTTPTISSSLSFDGSYQLTLAASPDGTITATDAGGTISGNGTASLTVTPGNGEAQFTFKYTPAAAGSKTITGGNGQGWSNPAALTYTAGSSTGISPSPSTIAEGTTTSVAVTGTGTNFTTVGQFSLSGGTGASIVSGTINSPTSATLVINGGTALGNLTLTDTGTSTSATLTVADLTAPTAPGTPTASGVTQTGLTISWAASTDNVTAQGSLVYLVYRNGVLVDTTAAGVTTFTDSGLATDTSYAYTAKAEDQAGNVSAPSGTLNVTTRGLFPVTIGSPLIRFA